VRGPTILLAAMLAAPLGAQGTKADSADARCVTAKLDTLQTANGVGARRNLATAGRACAARWLARERVARVDTVTLTKIVTRTDTLPVPAVPSAFVAATRVNLDSIDNDASAPAYSLRNQARIKARLDSVAGAVVVPVPTNKAPVASFTVQPCTAGVPCVFTSTSTDDGGAAKLTLDWSGCDALPACSTLGATAVATYPHEGTRNLRLIARDAGGLADTAYRQITVAAAVVIRPDTTVVVVVPDTNTSRVPVRAELPRVLASVTTGATKRVVPVTAGTITGDLQAALNASVAGDVLSLTGVFPGNFVIPTRPCGAGISIVASGPALAVGVRRLPVAGTATLTTPNNLPALSTAIPTCGWLVEGLEITGTLPMAQIQYGLVSLGDGGWSGGGEKQVTAALAPRDIILSHLYVHGSPTLNTMRCVSANSANTVIRDSWLSECHAKGFDSQAISGWNGPGPYLIENNRLEGAGENIMFGGADPGIPGLVPSDITIRANHIIKPLSWKGAGWTVKPLLELKSAQRVLVENNVLENVWPDAQEGAAVAFKSNANGCQCPQEGTRDVTYRWNIVRNAVIAINFQAWDNSYNWDSGNHTQRITVEQSLFTNIGAVGRGALNMWLGDLADVTLSRSTFQHATGATGLPFVFAYSGGAANRLGVTDNLLTAAAGYLASNDGGGLHAAAFTAFAGATGWTVRGNVVGGVLSDYWTQSPAGNTYLTTIGALGLTADGALPVGSPYAGKGVDTPELLRRTAGVVVVPPVSARALAARPVRAVAPRITRADSVRLAHQPRSKATKKVPPVPKAKP
jgi:hypothetical protein